jgi:hypothetical protein
MLIMKIKLLIINILFLFTNCENVDVTPMGTIEGKVTIGPLCGIVPAIIENRSNPCGLSDEALNKIYAEYKVVLNATGTTKTTKQDFVLNKSGIFKFEVPEGDYQVEIQKVDGSDVGINNSQKNTTTVKVTKSQTTKIEINVGTGIR